MAKKVKDKQENGVTLIPVAFIEDARGNRYKFVNEHINFNASIFYGADKEKPRLSIGQNGFIFAVGISKAAKGRK